MPLLEGQTLALHNLDHRKTNAIATALGVVLLSTHQLTEARVVANNTYQAVDSAASGITRTTFLRGDLDRLLLPKKQHTGTFSDITIEAIAPAETDTLSIGKTTHDHEIVIADPVTGHNLARSMFIVSALFKSGITRPVTGLVIVRATRDPKEPRHASVRYAGQSIPPESVVDHLISTKLRQARKVPRVDPPGGSSTLRARFSTTPVGRRSK